MQKYAGKSNLWVYMASCYSMGDGPWDDYQLVRHQGPLLEDLDLITKENRVNELSGPIFLFVILKLISDKKVPAKNLTHFVIKSLSLKKNRTSFSFWYFIMFFKMLHG